MKKIKKRGFTIVELVIVIAVIGILSAILIPTFSNLVKQAHETALQENLRNAYVEYTSSAANYDEYLGQDEIVFKSGEKYYQYFTEDDVEDLAGREPRRYYEIDVQASELELVGASQEESTYNKDFVAYKYKA